MRKLLFAGLAAASLMGGVAVSSAAGAQAIVVEERYGHWDPAWGAIPPPPMARWHHWRGDHMGRWYGHVHSCMTRYGHYDPRRDMYLEGRRWTSCHEDWD